MARSYWELCSAHGHMGLIQKVEIQTTELYRSEWRLVDPAGGGPRETGSPTWKHSLPIRRLRVHAGYANPGLRANREKRLSDEIEGYLIDEGRQKAKQLKERQIDIFS